MRLQVVPAATKEAPRPIIVRRPGREDHHVRHRGVWKIAYADFVTAMMAFFLLLWLVNATTEQQRTGIAEYFNPTNSLSRSFSGAGQPFGGRTLDSTAALTSDSTAAVRNARRPPQTFDTDPDDALQQHTGSRQRFADEVAEEPNGMFRPDPQAVRQAGTTQLAAEARQGPAQQGAAPETAAGMASQGRSVSPASRVTEGPAASRLEAAGPRPEPSAADQRLAADRLALRAAAQDIRAAIEADPQLRALAQQMLVEEVPEGLRIHMVDGEGQALFATGVAAPNERGRALLLRAASVIARLSQPVEITGHTDSAPFRGTADARSNWELSVERANAARRLILEAGVAERRVRAVTGRADQDLLRPSEPLHPSNRRVSVLIVVNQAPNSSGASMVRSAQ